MTKSKISQEEVKKIAKLADLKLTENEVEKFQKQLSDVLNYVAVLDELDTFKVKPTSQVTGLKNITRDDETEPSLSQKESPVQYQKQTQRIFQNTCCHSGQAVGMAGRFCINDKEKL